MIDNQPTWQKRLFDWVKKKLAHLLHDYFGESRILSPAILLSGSLMTAEILLWRLHMVPAVYPSLFYLNTGLGALVGYYVSRHSTSKLRLTFSAVLGVLAAAVYYHLSDTLVGVSLLHVFELVLTQLLCMAGTFSAVRILMNVGLH